MARQQALASQTDKQTSEKVFPHKYMDRSVTPKPEQLSEHRSTTPKPSQQDRFSEFIQTPAGERTARYVDRTPSTNHLPESGYKSSNITDTGYCSASKVSNNQDFENRGYNSRQIDTPRMNMAQFDPNKYQDRAQTPSNSSGWSCSASLHSNDARGVISPTQGISDTSPLDMRTKPFVSSVSDSSSQDGNEFSLQNTKKVLHFDPESDSRQASLNEQYSHQYEHNEGHRSHSLQQKQDYHHNYIYARSNSVDELEIDKTRKKVASGRSNSVDDILDFDEPREQRTRNVLQNRNYNNSQRPMNINSGDSQRGVNSNNNNCASASQRSTTVEQTVKPKMDAQQLAEINTPLNSARLRPIRQRTRNAVVNILDSGEVCLEFVKQKRNEEKVVEVFVISSEGTQVSCHVHVLQLQRG